MKTSMAFYFDFMALVLVFKVELVASQVSACVPTPCQNGGACAEVKSGFVCVCRPGFSGDTCESDGAGVVCEHNTCANGGNCIITNGVAGCNCTPEYNGPACNILVNISNTANEAGAVCEHNSCANGGNCTITNGVAGCNCTPEYTGPTCDVLVNTSITANEAGSVCEHNSCANGGNCTITNGVAGCNCTPEYTGPACDILVNTSITAPKTTIALPLAATPAKTTTVKTISRATLGSESNQGASSVDLWIVIVIAIAAAIVVIFVMVLITSVILKGKRRRKRNRSSSHPPRMIAEFKRNVPQGDSAKMDNESLANSNMEYDAKELNIYDDPPFGYDYRSITGITTPSPHVNDNNKPNLTKKEFVPTSDYGYFTK